MAKIEHLYGIAKSLDGENSVEKYAYNRNISKEATVLGVFISYSG